MILRVEQSALGVEYLHRYDLAHIKPEEEETPAVPDRPSTPAPAITHVASEPPLSHTKAAVVRSAVMSEGLEANSGSSHPIRDAISQAARKTASAPNRSALISTERPTRRVPGCASGGSDAAAETLGELTDHIPDQLLQGKKVHQR